VRVWFIVRMDGNNRLPFAHGGSLEALKEVFIY